MTRTTFVVTGLAVLAATTLSALAVSSAGTARPTCPGKIVCPLTGDLVCRDQCPSTDASRVDCPGRINCPLTGELVLDYDDV